MKLGLWYLASLAVGVALGALAAMVFRSLVPAGTTAQYWNDVASAVQGLMHGDEDQFWKRYFGLIRRSLGYIGRQLVALAGATLPLIAVFHFAAPAMSTAWNAGGTLQVHPESAGRIIDGERSTASSGPGRRLLSLSDGRTVPLPDTPGSVAVCVDSSWLCKALVTIGFTVVSVDPESLSPGPPIVIRTTHDDWNPFWP